MKDTIKALLAGDTMAGDLTELKALSVVGRHGDGWKPTGIMFTDKNGETCIVDRGAVRWLTKDEWWVLMHGNKRLTEIQ